MARFWSEAWWQQTASDSSLRVKNRFVSRHAIDPSAVTFLSQSVSIDQCKCNGSDVDAIVFVDEYLFRASQINYLPESD